VLAHRAHGSELHTQEVNDGVSRNAGPLNTKTKPRVPYYPVFPLETMLLPAELTEQLKFVAHKFNKLC
jgi:hypothetical protein